MDIEKIARDTFSLVGCLLYGFMFGYLLSEMIYNGAINLGMIAGGLSFGYALRALLLR